MPIDVLENDHRIIDQARKRQGEAPEHHAVDGTAANLKHNERRKHGLRNRKEHCNCGPETSKKNQDHDASEEEPDPALIEERPDGRFNELRLIEDYSPLKRIGHVEQSGQLLANAIDNGDRVRIAALFEYGQIYRTLPVHPHHVELSRVGVFRFANVGHPNRRLPHYLQRGLIHVVQFELAIGVNVVVVVSDFDVTRGQHDIGLIDGSHNVHRAQLARFQLVRVDVEHDLPPSAAEGLRNRSARHAGQLIANEVLREILQSGFTEPVAFQGYKTDRQAG